MMGMVMTLLLLFDLLVVVGRLLLVIFVLPFLVLGAAALRRFEMGV